jgi:L1 cell adhesion molecule like protein
MTKLIPRNTTVPTTKSEIFSTAADGQTSVEICVLQGEREFVKDNKSLGNFRLDGIPPAPRGVPQIEVRFDIDANGILSVTATDKGSCKKADIKITGASTLAKEDVEKMVQDAERFAKEDQKQREAIDIKNQADSMVYQTRKQLSEFDEKLSSDLKEKIENKVNELETLIKTENVTEIKASMDQLQQEVMTMGKVMYDKKPAETQTTSSGPQPKPGAKGEDEVIDAKFTD